MWSKCGHNIQQNKCKLNIFETSENRHFFAVDCKKEKKIMQWQQQRNDTERPIEYTIHIFNEHGILIKNRFSNSKL